MRDDDLDESMPVESEPIDLDTDTSGELDEAMREALEAVEAVPPPRDVEEAPALEAVGVGTATATDLDSEEGLRAAVAAHREKALRTLADFENFRKRVQREREEESRFRGFEAFRDFLGVIDNLERAVASPGDVDDLKRGVEMILKQIEDLLRDHCVVRVDAVGEPFDPSLHEAVSRHEDADVSEPTVSEQLQAGYLMHDRLMRPAIVKVAMPSGSIGDGEQGG